MDKLFWKREGENGYDIMFRKHEFLGEDYPKNDAGAVSELLMRGLRAKQETLDYLKENLHLGVNGSWSAEEMDEAANFLNRHECWGRWAIWCYVSGIEYGQAVRAYRDYFTEKHGEPGGNFSFDPKGVKTVIHPAAEGEKFGRVEFLRGE